MVALAALVALLVGGFATLVVAILLMADRLRVDRTGEGLPSAEIRGQRVSEQQLAGTAAPVAPRRATHRRF